MSDCETCKDLTYELDRVQDELGDASSFQHELLADAGIVWDELSPTEADRNTAAEHSDSSSVSEMDLQSRWECARRTLRERAAELESLREEVKLLRDETTEPKPRPVVLRFAAAMEERLRANDHKGGWKECDPLWLLERMRQELNELDDAFDGGETMSEMRKEAADVANFAMMVADICGDLASFALASSPTPSPAPKVER